MKRKKESAKETLAWRVSTKGFCVYPQICWCCQRGKIETKRRRRTMDSGRVKGVYGFLSVYYIFKFDLHIMRWALYYIYACPLCVTGTQGEQSKAAAWDDNVIAPVGAEWMNARSHWARPIIFPIWSKHERAREREKPGPRATRNQHKGSFNASAVPPLWAND